ncbi:MAG: aminodeoxychorismate synthase component I [Planctomycetaceae bacterium]|nr:aminodeoxychorismate synthase component I [Planctomycetaceae bacterium]
MTGRKPFVRELTSVPSRSGALAALANWPNVLLLESVLQRGELGRYSFLMANPVHTFVCQTPVYGADPFREIRDQMAERRVETIPDLPPFQGGVAGLLSYELGGCFERLPLPEQVDGKIPSLFAGLYEWVLAWDHGENRCWLMSTAKTERAARAQYRQVTAALDTICDGPSFPLVPEEFVPIRSNFRPEEYISAVQRVIEYIRAGDIFQANLSQRFQTRTARTPVEQYLSLRHHNAAPFAGFLNHEDWSVISSSPERFLQVRNREVITRPIKGTRQRRNVPEADLYTRDELRESEKDRAENVMIVDLLRNDLSRVCRMGSIRVPELCVIEAYETVTHLVSEVRGELEEDASFWDLLTVTFPGGSITGAPKIRAMEIITELEQITRGPYCGSLFYCGFDGTADSSILIRTMRLIGDELAFSVGGGIVAQSHPRLEYEETLHKASGMLRSLGQVDISI